jgi:hypothetical protein
VGVSYSSVCRRIGVVILRLVEDQRFRQRIETLSDAKIKTWPHSDNCVGAVADPGPSERIIRTDTGTTSPRAAGYFQPPGYVAEFHRLHAGGVRGLQFPDGYLS